MEIRDAYNNWAEKYDTNLNKTRDLEAIAKKKMLGNVKAATCLEIGCGTGKNTGWLLGQGMEVTAVDFSAEMLEKAKQKYQGQQARFIQADITQPWTFAAPASFDLVTFSLVLEHIEDLDAIMQQVGHVTHNGSTIYIGELHPFRQYGGSKAKYPTDAGWQELTTFTHHFSDFIKACLANGFSLVDMQEFLDSETEGALPRILAMTFVKK